MKNEVRIYAFSKTNKAAEKRFDKWLRENDINGQVVKIWGIDHGHNFTGRTRYITTVDIALNGQRLKLTDGTDGSHTFDAWKSVDGDNLRSVDRFKDALLQSVMDDKNFERIRSFANYRLGCIRSELQAERISYGELAELKTLVPFIDKDDVELLEAAGVPESN